LDERVEYSLELPGGDPYACVNDVDRHPLLLDAPADGDSSAIRRELQSVGEQV